MRCLCGEYTVMYREDGKMEMFGDWYSGFPRLEREDAPLSQEERLCAAGDPLLFWYRKNRRVLPWREKPEPYRVWISEIMLQQTRVEAVKPYFARFMEALPDIAALSSVEEERLLKLWEGLGYYTRARNLQKAAGILMKEYEGRMPASYEAIRSLPGIGSYTAGAVSSIAFNLPWPAVDGNVLRVMTRLYGDGEEVTKPAVRKRYEGLLRMELLRRSESKQEFHCGEYNQAWIELGALVCLPSGRPLCETCPLQSLCMARRSGTQESYPVKPVKKPRRVEKRTVFLIEWEDRVAIRKRSSRGLLASLYEFPNLEGHLEPEQAERAFGLLPGEVQECMPLSPSVHIFSHVEWHMIGYRLRLRQEKAELFDMVKREEIFSKYPLPNAFGAYTKALL